MHGNDVHDADGGPVPVPDDKPTPPPETPEEKQERILVGMLTKLQERRLVADERHIVATWKIEREAAILELTTALGILAELGDTGMLPDPKKYRRLHLLVSSANNRIEGGKEACEELSTEVVKLETLKGNIETMHKTGECQCLACKLRRTMKNAFDAGLIQQPQQQSEPETKS